MYISATRRLLNQGQALQSFVNTSRERSVPPLLLSIAALCQPFFQFNDEVERRDLPEQGFWAPPKSHWMVSISVSSSSSRLCLTYLSLAEPKRHSPSRLYCVPSRGPHD